MKRMLFNATHPEELRVAIVDGQTLVDLDIEFLNSESKRGNIYKGTVTKVEPSLEAVFVDYGAQRQGFLSLKDISRKYFSSNYTASTPMAQVKVQDVIEVGTEMIVQVEKNERGSKGAALTTFISLAGRCLVFLPNNPRGGGISRQVEGSSRHELKEVLSKLEVPDGHSIIARTAGIGQNVDSFKADLNYLINLWNAIETTVEQNKSPMLIYQESSLIVRTLRDYLRDDVKQILIDDHELFVKTKRFVKDVMPSAKVQVEHYSGTIPLFSKYQIEHQIKNAFERDVSLPNGGVIVIEQTEAMVTIDVNSARSTKGADIEETAVQTNLEAVDQISKQLRVRDIGGLIVIDFIDMNSPRNRRKIEKHFAEAVESDRARTRIGKISQFGLLELSRQRLRSSIEESSHEKCPRCKGRGFIRSVTSTALDTLRFIEEESRKESTELIHAHLPVDVATFLVNEKRHELNTLESRTGTRVFIIPTRSLLIPDQRIIRFTAAEIEENDKVSYTLENSNGNPEIYNIIRSGSNVQQAAVSQENLRLESNLSQKRSTPWLKKAVSSIFGREEDVVVEQPRPEMDETKPIKKRKGSKKQTRTTEKKGHRSKQTKVKSQTSPVEKPAGQSKKSTSNRRRKRPSGNSIYYPDPNSNSGQSEQIATGNSNGSVRKKSSGNTSKRPTRPRRRSSKSDKDVARIDSGTD